MRDVIIAGGGPVGLYAAGLLKKAGKDCLVLEEHLEIGRPNHCSGLISANLEKFVKMDESFIEHRVSGCILHSKNHHVKLTKPGTAAYVVDREKFDKHLAEGLDIAFGTRVTGFSAEKKSIKVSTTKGEFEARVLLACDGANSMIRKELDLEPKDTMIGTIIITEEKNSSDHVEMWFDKTRIKDGFFWKIPRGRTTEYGAIGKSSGFSQVEEFFGLSGGEKRAGVIAFGPPKRTCANRILLVGDAACQTKPWSGGGVIYGLTAAQIAVDVVKEAFRKKDFSVKTLGSYDKKWRKALGRPLRLGMFYRSAFKRVTNVKIDYAFSVMKKIPYLKRLDMDFL
jgi:geranylgeranyl reductase family protein